MTRVLARAARSVGVVALALATARASDASADWPTFHGDAARTGARPLRPVLHPRLRWVAEVGVQAALASPLIVAGLVVVPSAGRRRNVADPLDGVVAVDLATGKRVWFTHTDADAVGATVAGKRLVVAVEDGSVRGLALADGREAWRWTGAGSARPCSPPVQLGDLVVVGDDRGRAHAFEIESGALRWEVQLTGSLCGGGASDGASVLLASDAGDVAAIAPDGKARWHVQLFPLRAEHDGNVLREDDPPPADGAAVPIVSGDVVIVGLAQPESDDAPPFVALDRATGAVRWRALPSPVADDRWGSIRSAPTLAGDTLVYVDVTTGDVASVDARTGRPRFRATAGACAPFSTASAAAAGDLVYVPHRDGSLFAMHPDGAPVWSVAVGDGRHAQPAPLHLDRGPCRRATRSPEEDSAFFLSPVALAPDGTIVVGTDAGTLLALDEGP